MSCVQKLISVLTAVIQLMFKYSMIRYCPRSLFCLCQKILHLKKCKLAQSYKFW